MVYRSVILAAALLAVLFVSCSKDRGSGEDVSPGTNRSVISDSVENDNSSREPAGLAHEAIKESHQQNNPAEQYFTTANQFAKEAQYDSAIFYFEKASRLFKTDEDWEKYVRCYNRMGENSNRKGAYEQAMEYLEYILEFGRQHLGEEHAEVANTYHNIGAAIYDSRGGSREQALEYYQKALSIWKTALGERHPDLAKSYNNIANIYMEKGDYDRSISLLEKALSLKIESFGEQHPKVATSYLGIANAYNFRGDFEQAIVFYQKALSIWRNALGEQHPYVGIVYNNLGSIYDTNKGEPERGLEFYNNALSIWQKTFGEEHPYTAGTYANIGVAHFHMQDYQRALFYHNKALAIDRSLFGEKHLDVALHYINLGGVYEAEGHYDKALKFYKDALAIYKDLQGEPHPDVAAAYNDIGEVYLHTGQYQQALGFFQQAICANARSFSDFSPYQNPPLDSLLSEKELLKSLSGKMQAFERRSAGQPNERESLEAAVSTCFYAVKLIDRMRSGYKAEGSKLILAEQANSIYGMGIQYALRLYNLNADEQHQEDAFLFAEKSKTGILLEAISEAEAKQFAGIPDTLLEREKQLRIDLTFYDKSLTEEKLKREAADSARIVLYQNRVFGLKQAYDALLQKFEDEYPDYYQLKYQVKTATVAETREKILDENSTLIEYFTGEDSIYIFTISRKRFDISAVAKDSLFGRQIFQLRNAITAQNGSQYCSAAYSLYRALLAPVEKKLVAEKLIIIPDGLISYIPFEALLTEEVQDTEAENYSAFPFLIKEHAVSYAYSATLLLETLNRRRNEAQREYLACAPVFPEGVKESNGSAAYPQANRGADSARPGNFSHLPATRAEVLNIENLFIERSGFFKRWFGDISAVYLEDEATEANLKSAKLSSYRYLHFATHGFVNEANPKLSGLVFVPDSASGEDGVLYLSEMYNLNLNADLVVLSACETGLGKISRGEGLIGLSRGFLYAGAANLLVSLWQINDVSTANLMVEFYRNMLDGQGKTTALRDAKQALMDSNPQYANPYYWAPFVLVGR